MKTALVTGAIGGIGRAIVKKFLKDGYFVIGQFNKNLSGKDEFISELEKEGLSDCFFAVQCDFTDMGAVKKMIDAICKDFKHIDVLVNNAGAGLYKLITQTTEKEWDDLFNINMKSAFVITNGVLGGMIDRKSGAIINVSSMWGQVGASMEVCYSASKGAMIAYTKALAKEVAPSGITVNCVCPGVIDTPINARFSKEEMLELKEQTPLGRIGNPEDVAELVFFLSQKGASYITGQVVTCDGGFSL